MINATQLRFLQGLLKSQLPRDKGHSANYFANNFHIGVLIGRQYEYNDDDVHRATLLLQSLGHSLDSSTTEPISRADMANRPGLSEKSGSTSPHASSVAVRVLEGSVPIGKEALHATPAGIYSVLTVTSLKRLKCEALLVVENFETFRDLDRYAWIRKWFADQGITRVVAVYRGDQLYKIEDAAKAIQVIADQDKSVKFIGFGDFDPAGLHICASLPRLTTVLLPDPFALKAMVLAAQRYDLFHNQAGQYGPSLDASAHPEIHKAWTLLKHFQRGLPQEWMRDYLPE